VNRKQRENQEKKEKKAIKVKLGLLGQVHHSLRHHH
jgi:hypothetical protein